MGKAAEEHSYYIILVENGKSLNKTGGKREKRMDFRDS